MHRNRQKVGWLLITLGALGLIACKSKHSSSDNYQILECAQGTESLGLDLKGEADRFDQNFQKFQGGRFSSSNLSTNANRMLDLCYEYDGSFDDDVTVCVSHDALSGDGLQLYRDSYNDTCERALPYGDTSRRNRWSHRREWKRPPRHDGRSQRGPQDNHRRTRSGWADFGLNELKPLEIALYVADSKTLGEVLRYRKNPKAFVNGQALPYAQAQQAAERGSVACAVRVNGDTFTAQKALPVLKIEDHSSKGRANTQSFTLVTNDGFQVSCQTSGTQPLTARGIQQALGSVIEIRS